MDKTFLSNGEPTLLPPIDSVEADAISVGRGGKLVVPREDPDAGLDDGTEIDLSSALPIKVCRPGRREWVALFPASELKTVLLPHRRKADAMEEEYYFVAKDLRGPLHDDLKQVRVLVFYSFSSRTHGLWVIKVTPGNSWYESLHAVLRQPATFFAENAIRVISDRPSSCYRVKYKPMPGPVAWPEKATGDLLGEALGPDHFITTPDHPLYRELTEGEELT